MRYRTFLVTGVEVLHLGGQRWESNAWPPEHWREHKGRWRIFTLPLDEFVSRALQRKNYGGGVEGCVIALEIADFDAWPERTFTKPNTMPSFKRKHREIWFFARLDWKHIQSLTLKQQYAALCQAVLSAVLSAVHLAVAAKRIPNGFNALAFAEDLRSALRGGKPSAFTRAAYDARAA